MRVAARVVATLFAAALLFASPARAERTRVGEAPEAVEAGDCELELGWERRLASGQPTEYERTGELACGIGWRTEIALAFSRRGVEGVNDHALGLEVKTAIRDRPLGGVGLKLLYGIGGERPGGGRWRQVDHFAALEAAWQPSLAWLLQARLGTAHDREARVNSTLWALGVEWLIAPALEGKLELDGDDRGRSFVTIGLKWPLWPDRALLSVGYGVGIGAARERRVGIGLTIEF